MHRPFKVYVGFSNLHIGSDPEMGKNVLAGIGLAHIQHHEDLNYASSK